ncbi:hypothetical protein [Candidatus Leptofilum sp.]|uniref:hypothetical protein n=1 Tax=Candidatus Leptofilum sp. TaxID=3241576 RepID=UPI003B5CBB6E
MKRFVILLGFLWVALLLVMLLNLFVANEENFGTGEFINSLLGFGFFTLILLFMLGVGMVRRASFPLPTTDNEGFYLQFDGYKSQLIHWQEIANCELVRLGSFYKQPIYGISLYTPVNQIFSFVGTMYGLGTHGFLIDLRATDSEKFFNTLKNMRQDLFLKQT